MPTVLQRVLPGRFAPGRRGMCLRVKIYDIFEGTAEIQRLVISRAISGVQVR
jgi:alkylation response protein AidB-like acyl-CoA dehydrogenase